MPRAASRWRNQLQAPAAQVSRAPRLAHSLAVHPDRPEPSSQGPLLHRGRSGPGGPPPPRLGPPPSPPKCSCTRSELSSQALPRGLEGSGIIAAYDPAARERRPAWCPRRAQAWRRHRVARKPPSKTSTAALEAAVSIGIGPCRRRSGPGPQAAEMWLPGPRPCRFRFVPPEELVAPQAQVPTPIDGRSLSGPRNPPGGESRRHTPAAPRARRHVLQLRPGPLNPQPSFPRGPTPRPHRSSPATEGNLGRNRTSQARRQATRPAQNPSSAATVVVGANASAARVSA